MTDLRIITEWEDPKRAKGEELRATWASLKIQIELDGFSDVVTRFFDKDFNTVRQQVYGPMYPLAEWMAFHWFQILHGTERAAEKNQDLRFGAEGYALPRLRVYSEGDDIRLRWTPYSHHGAKVEFLGNGDVALSRATVEREFCGFLGRVVARLEEYQITNTPLQSEWQGILELNQEEREFCIAAASLGLDPFNLPEGMEEKITGVAEILSKDVMEEFFPASDSESLREDAEAISAVIQRLGHKQQVNKELEGVRHSVQSIERAEQAWKTGYEAARRVRARLGINDGPITLDTLMALGEPTPVEELGRMSRISGIVTRNCEGSTAAIRPDTLHKRTGNLKFSIARILCERLMLPTSATGLVTREKTTRQKLNRAFAAEMLAPADGLRKRITQLEISREEVQDLADEFEVSPFVIENQLLNHNLAKVTD